jgi:hypothetical protein
LVFEWLKFVYFSVICKTVFRWIFQHIVHTGFYVFVWYKYTSRQAEFMLAVSSDYKRYNNSPLTLIYIILLPVEPN